MESKNSIIISSFLRIAIIPIIVFFVVAVLTLNLIEPGVVKTGFMIYSDSPEDYKEFGKKNFNYL